MPASPNDGRNRPGDPGAKGRKKMQEGVSRRAQADEVIGGWWRYLLLADVAFGLGALVAFVLLVPGMYGIVFGYIVMYIAGFALLAIFTYKQTKRLAEHTGREAAVRQGMLELLRDEKDAKGSLKDETEAMERIQGEAEEQERLPNPLYAAMAALPLIGLAFGLYYLYHLNRLLAPHDARWIRYLELYGSAAPKIGMAAPTAPSATAKRRSFALYALLTLIFFPFLAYWYHILISEANRHFKAQWKAEDELIASL